MVIIQPTDAQIAEARADARKMGVLPNSKIRGRGNFAGMLAEICAAEWLGAVRVRPPVYSHDLEHGGKSYDVKAKRCSSAPLPEYTASVFDKNGELGLEADRLLFTRVHEHTFDVYLLGWTDMKRFAKKAAFVKAGTREGGFLHRADGWHLPISALAPVESLLKS